MWGDTLGQNAAGTAIKQELEARGHHVVMRDPYELVSHELATDYVCIPFTEETDCDWIEEKCR